MRRVRELMGKFDNLKRLDSALFRHFFVCGDPREDRIRVEYFFDSEDGVLLARILFGRMAQGPPDHAHGGAISAVFDEAMGLTSLANGYPAMTARMTIDYFAPVRLGEEAVVKGWIDGVEDKKVRVKAELAGPEGEVLSRAEGLFIVQSLERLKELGRLDEELLKTFLEVSRLKGEPAG